MISVVLPTFNGEKYIAKAIECILNQTYKEFELIIVDDCSNDTTPQIINRYKENDNRIKVIRNVENQKLPKSLNIGFGYAQGDYLTWTSDDNYYMRDAFSKMYTVLQERADVDVVYSPYMRIDEDGREIGRSTHVCAEIENLYAGNIIGACFLYKKEVHQKLEGYDESKFLVEDYDFWLRSKRYFKFHYLDQILYYYREHSQSLTTQRREQIAKMTIRLLNEELEMGNCSEKSKENMYVTLIDYSLLVDDISEFKKYMKKLREQFPKRYQKFGLRIRLFQYIHSNRIKQLFFG